MKKIIITFMILVSAAFSAPTMAPDFSLTTTTGEKVSLNGYLESQKPTLVYFTASWCPVCAKNWPSLNTVYKEYKDKVNFIAISIDPTDTNDVLNKLAKKHNLEFPMVSGQPKLMVDFGVRGQATTIIVNKKGKITFMERGHITLEGYEKILSDTIGK
ncbi:TlpA disulfide reductase family protein [Arcobacteraceae bacterium]|nr:TlpA disulfide reductase family protein [Arcobacteraceae bacterium]